ncbi:MAG: hypothetical protein NTX13_00315 [Acidobacteria bacterium]|nr:hypothetical protein [Acidobacteriota bacterium]
MPAKAIRPLADNPPPNPDGIRGRAALVFDPASRTQRIGRFGWKAQVAT